MQGCHTLRVINTSSHVYSYISSWKLRYGWTVMDSVQSLTIQVTIHFLETSCYSHTVYAQCGKLRETTWTNKNLCLQTSGYNNKLIKERKTNREEITIKYRNYHISRRDFAMTDKVNELYLGTVKWIFVWNLVPLLLNKCM